MTPSDSRFAGLSARNWHDIGQLRSDVFVVEQACIYPEFDGRDTEPATRHIWLEAGEQLFAYLRVLDDVDVRRIGRVVTRAEHRGRGLAAGLIMYTLDATRGPWVLDAQAHLEAWYAGFGFERQGAQFMDYGIPHVSMRRSRP